MYPTLLILLCVVINIPMGIWRSRHRKFSWQWFAAVHLPVPLVVLLRISSGISWGFIPVFILASIFGQLVGPKLCARHHDAGKNESSHTVEL